MFAFEETEAIHMNAEDYKKIIIEMLDHLNESDAIFLRQIYTLIKKHMEKKERR